MDTLIRRYWNTKVIIPACDIRNLMLFPIASKSLEANPRHLFTFCRKHILQEVFLQLLQLVELTLMKGDKAINSIKIICYFILFVIRW